VQTRHGSPTGIRLIASPVLDVARNSSRKVAETPTRISTHRTPGLVSQHSTQTLLENLIRGFEYAFAIGVALLCSYWILQGRW
jgi:hypothetical protein